MIPTDKNADKVAARLPRNAKIRALSGGRVLVVTQDGTPRVFDKNGGVSPIQMVHDAVVAAAGEP